ncbi:putative phosphoglycerate mutase pmu1 [Saxophila tyrrhenica]|uniref:Phosphoglycerate mutase pmu1 n=1 Tax=Saxophila tyrrhenica TaxID=1690608 RepID=A0AAV9P2L2_9PEZI|nr:putative phosphoglycerate mutase pmu1 [Saxophila tyrrhenica]
MHPILRTTAVLALWTSQATASQNNTAPWPTCIKYSTVTGYFLQDEPDTNATTFDYTEHDFGLIKRNYPATAGLHQLTQWQKFERQVEALNADAPLDTVYKVLFLGRHGEGYHNAAESFYGTPAWNCYWAELNGNKTVRWADAHIDAAGIEQAQIAHNFWKHEIEDQKIPYPQSYYTSPLSRCLQTANITFSGLDLPAYYPFVPTVKELLREGISIHTCDHRRSKSYIQEHFPFYNIEAGFTEDDELWDGVRKETPDAQDARSKKWLDQVFVTDDHTWISVTSHSGEIASTLRVLRHQEFSLNTGAVIPVLVKAEFLPESEAPSTTSWSWTASSHCTSPPMTSLQSKDQGCRCTGSKVTTPLVKVTNTNTAGPTTYRGPYRRAL